MAAWREFAAEKSAAWDSAYEIALREVATPDEAEVLLELYHKGHMQALDVASEGATDDDTVARVLEVLDPLRTAEHKILGEARFNAFIKRQAELLHENGGFSSHQQ